MSIIVGRGNISNFAKKTLSGTLLLPPHFRFYTGKAKKFAILSENVPKTAILSLFSAFLDNPLTLLLPPYFRNFLEKFYPNSYYTPPTIMDMRVV